MEATAPQIIQRTTLPGIESMVVEGKDTALGIVKNFKNNDFLRHSLPQNLAISWTHLDAGEKLDPHFHPCPSMIIVVRGEGASLGDTEIDIKTGDVLHIPAWNSHGFVGTGHSGFWALSIQFQETAIFEKEEQPFTTYQEDHTIPPIAQRQIQVITRNSLPKLQSVQVGQENYDLGEVRNFRESRLLSSILPDDFSAAWVGLEPGQELKAHTHKTDSMIIVTEGCGLLNGDTRHPIEEGDVIYVPAGGAHGFVGQGENGFRALSIQFEHKSLYERGHQPAVQFLKTAHSFDQLCRLNRQYQKKFRNSSIFQLLDGQALSHKANFKVFLGSLQVMSDYFQKLLFSRIAYCDDNSFRSVYYQHFLEELGHDIDLKKERGGSERVWDPVLEGIGAWFVQKSQSVDKIENIALVQMALEGGAHIFYEAFSPLIKTLHSGQHFSQHAEADEGHENLGLDLLENLSSEDYQKLAEILRTTWEMLIAFLNRVHELSTEVK